MIEKSPTFQYWELILEFEIAALIFVRAHRTKNFDLYIESLELLAPWFFALDHINYSRWIPIHIRDMKSLPDSIKCDMKKYWVISKTHNKFSSMPIDQVHEQNNKIVKGSGGAIGLTDNPVAFRRWMVAGPEQARLLSEFEGQFMEEDSPDGFEHHEQNLSSQELFKKHVSNLFTTMSSMGNPFMDDCPELLALDSRNCATEAVVDTVRRIKDTGQSQYQKFVTEVVVDRSATIHEPIKKNSLPLWKRPSPRVVTKSKQKVASLKSDCNLFSHLYIASKFRDNNLEDFFSHENHPWPPSLSENGKLHLPSKKADLLSHLKMNSLPDLEPPPSFDAKVFDGAAIVHALPTSQVTSFNEYCSQVFLPWSKQQLRNSARIDIVWDRYFSGSLKQSTREKRGKGVRRKVKGQTKLPSNFKDFLWDNMNKTELFDLLTEKVSTCDYSAGKTVYITSG